MSTETHTAVPSTESFGARLALIRWQMSWNAKEAALACNLSPQSWREWELSGRRPHNFVEVAQQIAERTGIDDYWIMTGKTKSPSGGGPGGQDAPAARGGRNKSPLADLNRPPSHYMSDTLEPLRLVA